MDKLDMTDVTAWKSHCHAVSSKETQVTDAQTIRKTRRDGEIIGEIVYMKLVFRPFTNTLLLVTNYYLSKKHFFFFFTLPRFFCFHVCVVLE